jgi:hypothetical protein
MSTQYNQSLVTAVEGDIYSRMNDPLLAVEKLGEIIASSGMFGCSKVEQGQVLALQCLSERKPPLELAKTYHVIDGKLSMRSDAMLAKFQISGGSVKWTRRDDKVVEATFTLKNNSLTFTAKLEDFVANGVAIGRDGKLKDNWRKFTRQMLTARVISEAVRLLAPEVVFGVYTPEEVSDFNSSASVVETKPVEIPAIEVEFTTIQKLEALLEPHEAKANAYLVSKGELWVGQNFRDLREEYAKKILSNSNAFLEIINKN